MSEVSVIVPVYNGEKYIRKCIDSILNQTFKNLECIVIDDGSTDKTLKVLKKYSDPRLKVITKVNSGVSSCRNLGIEKAKGKYLDFVDADDWLTPEAIALKYKAMINHNVDLVVSDFYRVINDRLSSKSQFKKEAVISRKQYALKMSEKPAEFYYGVLWNKLYKKDIIDKYGLRMLEDVDWCEDVIFNMEYIKHAKKIFILKSPTYYYVRTKGSLVYNTSENMITRTVKMKLNVFGYYKKFLDETLGKEETALELYHFLFDSASDGIVARGLPTTYKIGTEKTYVNKTVLDSDSTLSDIYRKRKLLDRYTEIVATRNNLNISDVYIIEILMDKIKLNHIREYADYLGIENRSVTYSLARLERRKLIKRVKNTKGYLRYNLTSLSNDIQDELKLIRLEYEGLVYADLSMNEYKQFQKTKKIIKEKEKEIL